MIFLLVSNAVSIRKDKSILYSRVVTFSLFITILLVLNDSSLANLNKNVSLYGGLYHVANLTQIFHIFILILSFIINFLTSFYSRKIITKYSLSFIKPYIYRIIYPNNKILNKTSKQFRILEYPLIILFIIIGALFLISTNDLISIFLSIELQSYGLYIICTLYRNSELSTSAGLTYFLLGGLSSCFVLLGSSILYVNSGTTFVEGLYIITNLSKLINSTACTLFWYQSYYIDLSLLIISVGFLFKLSASPFHFWSPDVYDAIPTTTTTVVAILGKISIFVLLLQLVNFSYNYGWTLAIYISSLLSLIVGTVGGLIQSRIKRLYAYSTISHTGFILLALTVNSIESIQAFIFYLIQYLISNLNAFMILITIGYTYYFLYKENNKLENNQLEDKDLQEVNNSPVQYIKQIKGYFYINPFLSISIAITFFSFIGLPPLIGFFSKFMVLSASIDNSYIYLSLVAILVSVISAGYYLAVIKQIFFYKPDINNLNFSDLGIFGYILKKNIFIEKILLEKITITSSLSIIISIFTLIISLFVTVPKESWNTANIISIDIFNYN